MEQAKQGSWGLLLGGVATGAAVCAAMWVWGADEEAPQQEIVEAPVAAEVKVDETSVEESMDRFLKRVSLGNTSSVDKSDRVGIKRSKSFQLTAAGLQAEGVTIDPEKPTVVYESLDFQDITVTQELKELRLTRKGEVVASYTVNTSKATVETEGDLSVVRFKDTFPGVDVKYTYDGSLVEEFLIFDDAFKKTLAKSGADNVEVITRMPGIKRGDTGALSLSLAGDATPLDTDTKKLRNELNVLHGLFPVATLPKSNAFIEGQQNDKDAHYIAARSVDLNEAGADISVELPANYIAEATGTVYLDPSIVDGSGSQHGWSQGRRVVKDSAGLYHIVWMRSAHYDDIGTTRWRMVYAYGDGTNWTYHGPISNPLARNGGQPYTHWHQYYGGIAIDGNDQIYVTWMEYNVDHPTDPNVWNVYWAKGFKESWTDYGKIEEKPVHQYPGALGVDKDNTVHLAYGSPGVTLWAYLPAGETEWVTLGGQESGWIHYAEGSAAVGPDGTFWIASAYGRAPHMLKCTADPATETGDCDYKGEMSPPAKYADGSGFTLPSAGNRRVHHTAVAVDNNGYIHVVYRMQCHDCWDPNLDWSQWRTVYARHDGEDWIDEDTMVIETNDAENVYLHEHPDIAVDENGFVHIVYSKFEIPSKVKYWVSTAPSTSDPMAFYAVGDDGELAPFSGSQNYATLRSSATLAGAPGGGPNQPTVSTPDNEPGIVEGVYINDNNELTFFSTGQPLELVEHRLPRDHGFINNGSSRVNFQWKRISQDNLTNTTYKLEVSFKPTFPAGDGTPNGGTWTKNGIDGASYQLGDTAGDPTLNNNRYYYWRVTPISNDHGAGPAGFPFEFGVDNDPPAWPAGAQGPDLVDPGNTSDPGTKTPTFLWCQAFDDGTLVQNCPTDPTP